MRNLSATALLLFAATAAAQTVVLPSAAATTKPSPLAWNSTIFYGTSSTTSPSDSHTQSFFDVNDITPPAAVWNSLQFRRPVGLGNANPAMTTNAKIVMSVSPTAHDAMSTAFASNHGTAQMTVFNGPLSLPARNNQSTWPYAWEAPVAFLVPFVYAKAMGKALVIDITQTGNTGANVWYLEATAPDRGSRAENGGYQPNCKFSNGNASGALGHTNPYVGGIWNLTYYSLTPNLVGVGAIGAQGVGGTWGSLTLPINLTPYGAPNCSWSVSADVSVALATNASGSASWTTVPVPNNPALAGQAFYDHAMFIDPPANAWGVATTWSSKWIVGTNKGAPGSTLSATGTAAGNATGSLAKESVATFQLNP